MPGMEPPPKNNETTIKPTVAQIKDMKLKSQKKETETSSSGQNEHLNGLQRTPNASELVIKKVTKTKSQKKEAETFSSNENIIHINGLQGTSNTSEFVIRKPTKTKFVAENDVIINYAGNWDESAANEKGSKISAAAKILSDDFRAIDFSKFPSPDDITIEYCRQRTEVIKNSVKNSKPDTFQSQAEIYNNEVKAAISEPLGPPGEPTYFKFLSEDRHEVVRKDSVVYRCHICKSDYGSKFSLKRHFVRSHINSEYLSASDINSCKVPVEKEKFLQQQFFEEIITPSGRKRFKIDDEWYFVPDGKTRVTDLYKCHLCPGNMFDIERELIEHYSSNHLHLNRGDVFPCTLCPSVFQKKQALSKHMSSHSQKKVIFHCKKCPQQFEKVTDFTCHLQSHGSGRNCKYCEKEFSTSANRKRHENIHERGRVFSCRLCKVKFPRSKDYEKHIKKMHCNEKLFCPHCPRQINPIMYTSLTLLETHITLAHQDIPGKKFGVSNKLPGIYKAHPQKLSKDCFCTICKKKFSSVKAMVNHKNIAHKNEISLRKPKKFGQKKELTKEKSQRYFEGGGKFKSLPTDGKGPGEKNVSSKVDDPMKKTGIFGKKRTTYERKAKSSSQHKIPKDKSYRKKDEAEKIFFSCVSSNVADNLLNHVDGGLNQINVKSSSFEDQNESFDYRSSSSEIPWSAHTFSNHSDFSTLISEREERPQLLDQESLCLYATGLEMIKVSADNALNLSSENSCTVEKIAQSISQDSPFILEEKEKIINHEISATFVCDVCKGIFSSYLAFEDHSVNNHPNVEVSFVEIEGSSKNPPEVPGELKRPPYTQPNGILVSCEVQLSTLEQFDMKCTKCETRFNDKDKLYDHIWKCGTKDTSVRRKLNQKNKKGLSTKNQSDSAKKLIPSSSWFTRKNGCYGRKNFQRGKYFFNISGNKRGRRRLPLPSKLRPNPCPHCESVFISSAKLPEHVEVCTYRFKSQAKKRKNDRSPSLSPVTVCENGSSSDGGKNSDVFDKDTSLLSNSNDPVLSCAVSQPKVAKAVFSSFVEVSGVKINLPDSNWQKTEFQVLRNIVKEVRSLLAKDLQVEDANVSSVKEKELSSMNSANESVVKSSVDYNNLSGNSRKNASPKSVKNSKSENIVEPFTAVTKETSPILVSDNIPKIKEVVKEIQLAASSSPNLKKNNGPMAFLSLEAPQRIEPSSINNNSPLLTGVNFQSEKEASATNESQPPEKARQRKKRKPVKIMHKITKETEGNLNAGLSPFSNNSIGSCLAPFSLENCSFKPIKNSGEQTLLTNTDSEIPKLPDLVPEKDKIDFHNPNEKGDSDGLEVSIVSSDNIHVSTGDERLSTPVFLPEDKPEGIIDRDSPTLELLVSSVTQSIENFDKPSLLDDEKFVLQTPDLITPTAIKSTDINLSSNNGLNFKILIPTGESPSKSQVSNKDSLDYFATKISVDKPTNDSPLPVSSEKNNVKTSVINKMKSILNVAEIATNTTKLKELNDPKIGNNVSSSAKNISSLKDNTFALTPTTQNGSATTSTTVNLLEVVPTDSQHSLCSDEIGKEFRDPTVKSTSIPEVDDKEESDAFKGDGAEKINNDIVDVNDSLGFKDSAVEQIAMADKVNTVSGQKSKKMKDIVKSKLTEGVPSASNETTKTDMQKKKASSKLSLNKKCDSKGDKDKSPVDNHQPKLALEKNKLLTNKNEDKVKGGISTSESSGNLRFLRMKRSLPDEFSDQTANKNKKLNVVSETDISHNQVSKSKKSLNNSGNVAVVNNSEAVTATNSSESVGTKTSNDGVSFPKPLDDCNVAVGDKDVVVKKEKPDNEIVTHRNCPYCYLDFAYLSNFRRHLKLCPSKTLNATSEAPASSASSQFQHLPKKNEVEESMLNLLRHQSRQNELIKETQKADNSKVKNTFKKFSCQECHKIYLSYFSYMQHVFLAHKMTQDVKPTDPDSPSTSHGVRVMSLEESESNAHQETRTSDPFGSLTSLGAKLPLEEKESENNMQLSSICDSTLIASDVPSELSINSKNSPTTNVSGVKESSLVDTSKKDKNTCSDITRDEFKAGNQEIKLDSIQNASGCLENRINSDGSPLAEKTKAIASSPGEKNVSMFQNDNDLSGASLLSLPAYGKGRGRKKKIMTENLVEKKDLEAGEQSKKIGDNTSVNNPTDDRISKTEPVSNSPLLKEVGKALLSGLKSSPKSTLVNKLRSTLSKSMQSGGNLEATPSKLGKKSENSKNGDVSDAKLLEKEHSAPKSLIKKSSMETSKIIDKTGVSRPLNISRRGRKKNAVARVSVKQNVRGLQQESKYHLSQLDVPREAIESTAKFIETELSSGLNETLKGNKLKSSRKQIPTGPESPNEKRPIKKPISNAVQSSKMTKAIKSTKISLQEVSLDAKSSQKLNAVKKVKGPRSIKAISEIEPTPSTSDGPSRGRKPRVTNVSLDLSSELEDVEDIPQSKPEHKKKPTNKVCPICKQKFPSMLQRNRHLQFVHGRTRNRNEGSISPTFVPMKKETINKVADNLVKKDTVNPIADSNTIVPDRSVYQRQCSKPLPPMKRKYQKLGEKNIQPVKKTRL